MTLRRLPNVILDRVSDMSSSRLTYVTSSKL